MQAAGTQTDTHSDVPESPFMRQRLRVPSTAQESSVSHCVPELYHAPDSLINMPTQGSQRPTQQAARRHSHGPNMTGSLSLLSEWQETSKHYSLLHDQSSALYWYMNLAFISPIVLFSAGSGSYALFVDTCTASGALQKVMGLLGIAAGGLTAVYNMMKIDRRQEGHQSASVGFQALARDICMELHLITAGGGRSRYADVAEFLKECKNRYNGLLEASPSLPRHVLRAFMKSRGNLRSVVQVSLMGATALEIDAAGVPPETLQRVDDTITNVERLKSTRHAPESDFRIMAA